MQPTYLDYNATTSTDLRVVEAMRRYSLVDFGNASSLHHSHGRAANQAIDEARRKVAALLSAKPGEILFTSDATVTSAATLLTARLSIDNRYEFVATADNDPESPFRNEIDWPTNRTRVHLVKPAAIETAVRDIQERKIPEFEDKDTLIDYFFTLWKEVKTNWRDLWVAESKLLSKVGIVCMTQYVTNSVASSYDLAQLDITNPEPVLLRTRELLIYQQKDFWRANWSLTGKDNSAGRKEVVDALVQIGRNKRAGREWSEDLELLESEPE